MAHYIEIELELIVNSMKFAFRGFNKSAAQRIVDNKAT